jgi:phosphohistidine phosphatase
MRLLIIRHAIAVPHGTPGVAEDDRPLTPRGRRRFRVAARGLARLVRRPDAILTSPLPRARQTAEIAARVWGKAEPHDTAALAGGSWNDLAAALRKYPSEAVVAIVGHEPHLSGTLARLIGAGEGERLIFRKGGAALVDIPEGIDDGGSLCWFLTPRILRALARDSS